MKPSSVLRALAAAGTLAGFGVAAWTLPVRHWRRFCTALAATTEVAFAGARRVEEKSLPPFMLELVGTSRRLAVRRFVAGFYEQHMQYLAVYRPGSWKPRFNYNGLEHIDAALAAGRGAIIWNSELIGASLMTKMALHQAGHRMTHLSRPGHGGSIMPFHVGRFAPLVTRAEKRFLRERIVIEDEKPEPAMRILLSRLKQNGVVSITVGMQARQIVRAPMFGGYLQIATGPANLSRLSGAPLLPVFTVRRASDEFDINIEAPLALHEDLPREEALLAVATDYTALLESYVRRFPYVWAGWRTVGSWLPGDEAV
ncbi:MAG TPA: lysophospholipid acyltransferase family protein [Dehalococcoidia bacterium]|nr:lysophospholipid acyltransferase family protein [Dehalococcoidia bacterium]